MRNSRLIEDRLARLRRSAKTARGYFRWWDSSPRRSRGWEAIQFDIYRAKVDGTEEEPGCNGDGQPKKPQNE